MNVRFRAIRDGNSYKIVFEEAIHFTIARIRYENTPNGPYGAGWSVRCSEFEEYIERAVRAALIKSGKRATMSLQDALKLFREVYQELENEMT